MFLLRTFDTFWISICDSRDITKVCPTDKEDPPIKRLEHKDLLELNLSCDNRFKDPDFDM